MKKINESFICFECWKEVPKAKWTCRNHCPYCFASMHVDEKLPWDRLSECYWDMYPVEYIISNWKIKIKFECQKCWHIHMNKSLIDDEISNLDFFIKKYKDKF